MSRKCDECNGVGTWAPNYGKIVREQFELDCPKCEGTGYLYDSDLKWEELKKVQNELGRRSNPPFEVKEYRRGVGWQGVRWL
jgi:RecJ-like exonuclease